MSVHALRQRKAGQDFILPVKSTPLLFNFAVRKVLCMSKGQAFEEDDQFIVKLHLDREPGSPKETGILRHSRHIVGSEQRLQHETGTTRGSFQSHYPVLHDSVPASMLIALSIPD